MRSLSPSHYVTQSVWS